MSDTNDVDNFTQHILNFHIDAYRKVKSEAKTTEEQIRESFFIWRHGGGGVNALKPVTVEALLQSLQANDRKDLANIIAEELNIRLEEPGTISETERPQSSKHQLKGLPKQSTRPQKPKLSKKIFGRLQYQKNDVLESTGLLEGSPEEKNGAGPELPLEIIRETVPPMDQDNGTSVELTDENASNTESEYYADYNKEQDSHEIKDIDDFSEGQFKRTEAGPELSADVTRETQTPESDPTTANTLTPPDTRADRSESQSEEPQHEPISSDSRGTFGPRRLSFDSSVSMENGNSGATPTSQDEDDLKDEDGDAPIIRYDRRNDRIISEFHNVFQEPADGNGVKASPAHR